MPKIEKSHQDKSNLKPNSKDIKPADQAEGERGNEKSTKVGRTPGQAEGERDSSQQNKK